MTTEAPHWYKSSYSDNGGECIEVATNLIPSTGTVPIRDSKNTRGPQLTVNADAFTSFVTSVKTGNRPS